MINLYIDGCCFTKFGIGGWCCFIKKKENKRVIFGSSYNTTNNRMELKAAIEGLLLLSCNLYINVYTDSMYLKNGITNWIFDWEKTNWKNQKNCTIKNVDMWIILFGILKNKKRVNWMWIKSHNNCIENNIADKISRFVAINLIV